MQRLAAFARLFLILAATRGLAAEPAATPQVVAHRGLIRHAPENTLASFRACLELRIGFELDVQRSRDGHLVCVHDATVDRTTNGTGRVADLTLAQLRDLDAGSWFDSAFGNEPVPTLDAVLAMVGSCSHEVLIAVDLKGDDDRIEADCVELAQRHGVLQRLLFIGRAIRVPEVRRRLREAAAETQIAVVANHPGELPSAIVDPYADWVYVRYVPSRAEVARVREEGRMVFLAGPTVAGVERDNWRQAVASGVDGILTDFPLVLRRTFRED